MSDTDKKPDQEKGDEILKRMLKTPPDQKKKEEGGSNSPPPGPGRKPNELSG